MIGDLESCHRLEDGFCAVHKQPEKDCRKQAVDEWDRLRLKHEETLQLVESMKKIVDSAKDVYSVRSEAVSFSQQGVTRSFEKYKQRYVEACDKLDAAVKECIETWNQKVSPGASLNPPWQCSCNRSVGDNPKCQVHH